MTATMTQPADLWTDANREEIDAENRMAEADARDEFEHNEAIRAVAESAAEILRPLMAARAASHVLKPILDREFASWRETLDLITGETWPTELGPFLKACDVIAKGDEEVAA